MLDRAKVGNRLTISGPLGEFVYLPVRDGKTVIGVAGGSGITPFHSFAKAIAEGDEDFRWILLYGSRTEKEGFEHGFVGADLIQKYAPEEDYSIFMCGPAGMYHFLDQEIAKLGIERKWVRHELQGEVHEPKKLEHRREADKDFNYIHPCCTFPLTDIVIDVPYI